MAKNLRLIFAIVIFLLVIAFGTIWAPANPNRPSPYYSAKLGQANLELEIATSSAAQELGLSYRTNLAPAHGLLFIFERPGYYNFWMKAMNFPLDFVWLDNQNRIADFTYNVATSTYPATFTSKVPAQSVIEINAGEIAKLGLKIGDGLEFSSPKK